MNRPHEEHLRRYYKGGSRQEMELIFVFTLGGHPPYSRKMRSEDPLGQVSDRVVFHAF